MAESASLAAQESLYIVGHPIAHSKSPAMYNAVYERLGLPWHYGFADLASAEEAQQFLRDEPYLSVNITTPYKPVAFEAATVLAASAKLARGVNVLVRKVDALIGYNTDGEGCVMALERAGVDLAGARVVVCGTGPTSLSIFHSLVQAGPAEVALIGRSKSRTQQVLETYAKAYYDLAHATIDLPSPRPGRPSFKEALEQVRFTYGSYDSARGALQKADVIVDATPLGMNPGDPAPFDPTLISSQQTIMDVVYGHGMTALLAEASARGAKTLDGSSMLVGQAVATLGIVLDIAGVSCELSTEELFEIMSAAAGFTA